MGQELNTNIYGYVPEKWIGIAFIAMFSLLTVAHLFQVIRLRAWWFLVLPLGGIGEIIGWFGRYQSAKDVYSLDAFLTQQICLVLAPCYFSAAEYAFLSMFIEKVGPSYARMRPWFYTWLFIGSDLISMGIQSVGGALSATALSNNESSTLGTNLMIAGIVFQLVMIFLFSILAIDYIRRARQPIRYLQGTRQLAYGLTFSTFTLILRGIYRTVELAQGWDGYLITHEVYFVALDTIPMALCLLAFNITHPGQIKKLPDAVDIKNIPSRPGSALSSNSRLPLREMGETEQEREAVFLKGGELEKSPSEYSYYCVPYNGMEA